MNEPEPRQRFRVAIVGCGAVTTSSLLPVLAGHEQIEVAALVDTNPDRARTLADAYGVARIHADLSEVADTAIDGLVLATPPAHHAPGALDALSRGWHVFVEKPMAISASDAERMVETARERNRVLSVGHYRRFLPVARLLRDLLASEFLGAVRSVDIEEGGAYTWPLASLTLLTREGGGGGVLIDIGSHLLDQLYYVLPCDSSVVRYEDNARGGIETDCEAHLALRTRWGTIPARVELSRTRQLRNSIRVTCDRGTIELLRGDFTSLRVFPDADAAGGNLIGGFSISAHGDGAGEFVGYEAFRQEFDDWLGAVRSGSEPLLSGRSVLPVVRTIEECYRSRTRLPEPWVDGGLPSLAVPGLAPPAGRRPRVLVTGAGGFLGCRLVECLLAAGAWDVRALVRRPASAARLARLPVEIVLGDVSSRDDMLTATRGCDAVVHCAVGTDWPPEASFKVTVDGTRNTAEAALTNGVSRFVHISSMAVHGDNPPPRLDETAPFDEGAGFGYTRAKVQAERAVLDVASRGLRAVILRPARIYGPFSRTFTTRPLEALRSGRLVLAGDADSPSNMVYVDNVVEAIVRALAAPDSVCGEAFLINEPDQLSWRAFYKYFAGNGRGPEVVAPVESRASRPEGLVSRWVGGVRQIVFSPELRQLAKKILWTDPIGMLPRKVWDRSPALQRRVQSALGVDFAPVYRRPAPASQAPVVFTISPTLVVFDKAATLLGYEAAVPRAQAMALTRAWAAAARLIEVERDQVLARGSA